jgi:hypothetical protein
MPEQNDEILSLLQQVDSSNTSGQHLLEELINKINQLIVSDFEKLVQLLYRVDVDEARLKRLLQENAGEDAAKVIALLLIERQQQKLKSRNEQPPAVDPGEDAW